MGSSTTRSSEIQVRFFQAFREAVRLGKIKSMKNFCKMHGLNRTKYAILINTMDAPERADKTEYRLIDMAALAALCEDAKVSPRWLLLGKGKMFMNRQKQSDDKQGDWERQVPASQAEQG
ncbi:MAG: hypothetical protein NC324_02730 [Bacteroides sp.]|nr:hypothetical protein [Bacteroides sp.]